MCGICGAIDIRGRRVPSREALLGMVRQILHRGPDEQGILRADGLGFGHARLSIIDLAGGKQPMGNEDDRYQLVFNGEIYNYRELRPELEAKGHRFSTTTDSEVLLHLFEEEGPAMLSRLNGQFAMAIWDAKERSLFLARDPVGIRPLFLAEHDGWLLFGSEIKSLLAWPGLPRAIDPRVLKEVFTFWSPAPGHSIFKGIRPLPPGHYAVMRNGNLEQKRWYEPGYENRQASGNSADLAPDFRDRLRQAADLRLRADVPVGAYLSGGIDSSVIVATVARWFRDTRLSTFSIRFDEKAFDEGSFQQELARSLGTDHHEVVCRSRDIAEIFPQVIEHTECPILRTAPAPMFLLSRLVRQSGYKVVLTGEGADEMLGGYDIFRETKIRAFWARFPGSEARPHLLKRLYPWMSERSPSRRLGFARAFFGKGIDEPDNPVFSHVPRWESAAKLLGLLSPAASEECAGYDPIESLLPFLPGDFSANGWLGRAQALEVATILSGYILSSQGDRMLMGNSVEGRFPFLDPELMAFAGRLPGGAKIRGLNEKFLLKQAMGDYIPRSILDRPKQPYRAPDALCFFAGGAPEWVAGLLAPQAIGEVGLFDPDAVASLQRKCLRGGGKAMSNTDNMSLIGVLSTMLLHERLVKQSRDTSVQSGENLVVDVQLSGDKEQ